MSPGSGPPASLPVTGPKPVPQIITVWPEERLVEGRYFVTRVANNPRSVSSLIQRVDTERTRNNLKVRRRTSLAVVSHRESGAPRGCVRRQDRRKLCRRCVQYQRVDGDHLM